MNGSFDGYAAISQFYVLLSVFSSVILPLIFMLFIIWAVFKFLNLQEKKNEVLRDIFNEFKNKKSE